MILFIELLKDMLADFPENGFQHYGAVCALVYVAKSIAMELLGGPFFSEFNRYSISVTACYIANSIAMVACHLANANAIVTVSKPVM